MHAQQPIKRDYAISAPEAELVAGRSWAGTKPASHAMQKYVVQKAVVAPAAEATPRRKRRKKAAAPAPVPTFAARATAERYDPCEITPAGFTVTLWVAPFASPAAGHGYALYPAGGADVGEWQSLWGITVGRDAVRVYERYRNAAPTLLLEYKHHEGPDFFISLVCRGRAPQLYINGTLRATGEQSAYSPHPALGPARSCPAAMRFIGKLSELHFFARALGGDEIAGLYKSEYAALHRQ